MDFNKFIKVKYWKSLLTFPVFSIILVTLSDCGTECLKFHSPIMPYSIYPNKDTIHVGDTIWIDAAISNNMKDFETGDFVNYNNVNFNSTFYFYYFNDTSKYMFREGTTQYANDKFKINPTIGTISETGNVIRPEFVRRNDSIFHRVYVIALDTGFFSINLGYNPGSTAHGRQKIDVGDKKCTHKLNTLCQSINLGKSTLQRAKEKGFKIWISPQPSPLEYWIYDNRYYFFTVVP